MSKPAPKKEFDKKTAATFKPRRYIVENGVVVFI